MIITKRSVTPDIECGPSSTANKRNLVSRVNRWSSSIAETCDLFKEAYNGQYVGQQLFFNRDFIGSLGVSLHMADRGPHTVNNCVNVRDWRGLSHSLGRQPSEKRLFFSNDTTVPTVAATAGFSVRRLAIVVESGTENTSTVQFANLGRACAVAGSATGDEYDIIARNYMDNFVTDVRTKRFGPLPNFEAAAKAMVAGLKTLLTK